MRKIRFEGKLGDESHAEYDPRPRRPIDQKRAPRTGLHVTEERLAAVHFKVVPHELVRLALSSLHNGDDQPSPERQLAYRVSDKRGSPN